MTTKELKKGDVLSVNAASEEIGMHHVTLYDWIAKDKVAYVEFGGIMFIPVAEVNRLKREKQAKAINKTAERAKPGGPEARG